MNTKYYQRILLIIILSALLRLMLVAFGNHQDLITNASWGQYLYINGMKYFYPNYKWVFEPPTQLPIINIVYYLNYIVFGKLLYLLTIMSNLLSKNNIIPQLSKYFFEFLNWFGWNYYKNTDIPSGFLVVMKMVPVIADVLIAMFILYIGRLANKVKFSIIVASLFLFLPLSWYLSALWGQYDQISALLFILSFNILYKLKGAVKSIKKTLLITTAVNMFMISFQIKPTIIYAAPLFLLVLLYIKPKIVHLVFASVSVILINYWSVALFTTNDRTILHYMRGEILPRVFFKTRFLFSNQAFNFWQFLGTVFNLDNIINISPNILFIVISALLFIVSTLVFLANRKDEGLWSALYIVTTGNFIFNIGMMNRYFFAGILSMAVLLIYKKRVLSNWLIAIALFSLNLYFSWGYPFNVGVWDYFWGNKFAVSTFSLINIVNFLIVLKKLNVSKDVVSGFGIIKEYVGVKENRY